MNELQVGKYLYYKGECLSINKTHFDNHVASSVDTDKFKSGITTLQKIV